MSKEIANIHDKFIKQILSNKNLAIDFLSEYLPECLVSIIDFQTLTYHDTSYISESLKASYSDLIWRVKINRKEYLQISLLLEHKSYADPFAVFQLLEYLALGYRKQIRENKQPELIVPILYYHGKKEWVFKPIEAFFRKYPDILKTYLPTFATEFVNLHQVATEQILALTNGLLRSAIMLQKHYFDSESFNAHVQTIIENMNPYWESNITDVIFVYMIQNERLDERPFMEFVKKLPDDMSTKVMSLYDQLIQRGINKGIEKALERTILNAYDNGIDVATVRLITGESEKKINFILKKNSRIG